MRRKYRVITYTNQCFDTNSEATARAISKRQCTPNILVWNNGHYEPLPTEVSNV